MVRLAILLLVLFTAPAHACRSFIHERSIFFDRPPQFTDGRPFVAKVTILKVDGLYGMAHVDEVLVGSWPDKEIKIRIPSPTTCGPVVRVGDHGMVAGEFYNDTLNLAERVGPDKTTGPEK